MVQRQLLLSGLLLGVALVIWLALLRPVPVRTATATVRSKTLRPAGEYVQYPAGARPGFRTATRIALPEHYVLGLEVDGRRDELTWAVNPVAAAAFEIGQRVSIAYEERGIPPFWQRSYVTDVKQP